jgi:hypothetical protein
MSGGVWELWDARLQPPPPLRAEQAEVPEAAGIPPREWLYGTSLIRRFVTLLVAPGGVGKSALALGQCVALATGRGFLGETVHHPAATWMLNLEDPVDELHRRLAALLIRHRVERAELDGRLFLHSGRTRRVCMARPGPDGGMVVFPDREAVILAARARGIGCIMVDPFIKSHGLEENSNTDMDAAATAWAEVAEATGAAVQLIHHVRKPAPGANPAADVDAARGGKALTDAARVALLLAPMTPQEAEALGVTEAERWRHVRLDDAKSNMAPKAARASWYRLDTVHLGNGTPAYPSGDNVAAISAWAAETVWSRLTPAGCNRALDAIAAGPEEGVRYASQRRGRGTERWAGRVLMDLLQVNETQAVEVIGAWLKSGLLIEENYRDCVQRKTRVGVVVIDAKRPTACRADAQGGFNFYNEATKS